MSERSFREAVAGQAALLHAGKPLEAFDAYYAPTITMYANDEIFAKGHVEGRAKQAPFIEAATSITGKIVDLVVSADMQICVFRNRSRFTSADGKQNQIDGLCWQQWQGDRIIEERYYDGEMMQRLIDRGVLVDPTILRN